MIHREELRTSAPVGLRTKRFVDVLGSSLLLALLAPLFLVLYLLVRLDSRGPVIYRSPRLGRHGRTFQCLKFRTMSIDADERLATVLATDPGLRKHFELYRKLPDDPRITRIGRFLRRSSLDELPQLVNVLNGTMSLVGPRPYLVEEAPLLGPWKREILSVRPGMTGLWQVSGRSQVTFRRRVRIEAFYAKKQTLPWDVMLLLRTANAVVRRGDAY